MDNKIQIILDGLGFVIHTPIKGLGEFNRCGTREKPKSKNGSFIIYSNCIWYQDFAADIEGTIKLNNEYITPKRDYERRKIRDAYLAQIKQERLIEIREEVGNFKPLTIIHPYFVRKQVSHTFGLLQDEYNNIVIPMVNTRKEIMGYQTITKSTTENNKWIAQGSIKQGSFHNLSSYVSTKHVFLCEGYATAASIYSSLIGLLDDYSVICCFDAGNVDKVYYNLFQQQEIGIRARFIAIKDDDQAGREKVKSPGFVIGIENVNGTDANDYHIKYGLDALGLEIWSRLL